MVGKLRKFSNDWKKVFQWLENFSGARGGPAEGGPAESFLAGREVGGLEEAGEFALCAFEEDAVERRGA